MTVEVDQSGKVEDTAKDTVIAFTNSLSGSVILPAKEKRKLQEWFREVGLPKLFVDFVFATLLTILFKLNKIKKAIIDIEYPGHTGIISELIEEEISCQIDWKRIGKLSKAHDLAYKVFVGKLLASRKVSAREVWKIVKKRTGGYLKTGLSPANRYSAPVSKRYDTTKKKKVK